MPALPRLFLKSHYSQLVDPANWRDNPFFFREVCRDVKKGQPGKSFAWLLGTVLSLTALAAWGLLALRRSGVGTPWFLGGSLGTALAIAACGIHVWFVQGAAQRHSLTLFAAEANRNTLPGLLSIPIPAFQLLVQLSAYPWFAGMRAAVAALPLYAFLLAVGGISIADLIMLYLVFALISFMVPVCARPMLADQVAFAPAHAGGAAPQAQLSQGQNQAALMSAQTGSSGSVGALIPFAFIFYAAVMGGRGGPMGALAAVRPYIPEPALRLLPTFFLSWPLLAARALITPFDWYGIPVPPLPFVLCLVFATRYAAAVRSSEFLRVAVYRDLYQQPSYAPRRALEAWLRTGRAFVTLGYVWKWGVVNGGFAGAAPGVQPVAAQGLAGLIYGLFLVAGWQTLRRAGDLGAWSAGPDDRDLPVRLTLGRSAAWRYAAGPLAYALGMVTAGCLLSRTWPFAPDVTRLGGQMLVTAIAGGAFIYFVLRAMPFLPAMVPLVLPILLLATGPAYATVAAVSPALGLLALGPIPDYIARSAALAGAPQISVALSALPPWHFWPAVSAALAAGFAGPALLRRPRMSDEGQRPVIDLAMAGREVLLDAVAERQTLTARTETPAGQRILEAIGRFTDNPVAMRELRARLRGRYSPRQIAWLVIMPALLSVGAASIPFLVDGIGMGFGGILYGMPPGAQGNRPAGILGLWFIALLWTSIAGAASVAVSAYAPEREKSTLAFLLTTPMRASEIVAGKAAGILIPAMIAPAGIALWTLVLTLLFTPSLGPGHPLAAWAAVMATTASIVLSISAASLAIAGFFVRYINQAGCGVVIGIVLIQAPVQIGLQLTRGGFIQRALGDASFVWRLFLLACLIVTLAGSLGAVWAVRRMRRGDITLDSTRRES